ncbi:MAG TPA: acyl-CoA dehydrogenase family protein [Roseiarcus sp.]|nr:acyl-CoA dehydrogenase family protein [Roseiarcus sp.]
MLTLNEDQRLLMESARGAIAAEAPISQYRALREPQGEGFSRAFWKRCGEMGWSGMLVAEAQGGSGFGIVGAGLVAREMARNLALSPFLSTAVLAATALAEGSPGQQRQWLPRIASAQAIVALAHDEPPGGEAVSARREGGAFRLSGDKHFVLDGPVADAFLVSARIDDMATLFLVEAGAPGVSRQTRILLDGRRVASLRLQSVEVAETAQLPGGVRALERTLDVGRAVIAASLSGVAEEALRRTLDYLKQRRQFGRAIGSFQALQHRAGLAHIAVENAWSASLQALQGLDNGANSAAFDVAVAKSKASRTAEDVTAECLQMHGGVGMTDAFDIGLYLKRARVEGTLFGDAGFHADRVATMLGY